MKGEDFIMYDRDGKLIVKVIRFKNRLYKVRMGLKEIMCYFFIKISELSRWYVRLGYINVEIMKFMMKRELVIGILNIDVEVKVCGLCLFGK